MKNKIKYKSNNNIVYLCKYHIVWCPKYRRKVLVGDVEKRLKEIIEELARELKVEIIENQQSSQRPKTKQKWEKYVRSLQI